MGQNPGRRALTVSAESAAAAFTRAGLDVLTQEKTKWTFKELFCDCFSLVYKRKALEAAPIHEPSCYENPNFFAEFVLSKDLNHHYTRKLT